MPVRYTSRLIVVDTPSCKVQVKYGYLGNCRRQTGRGGRSIFVFEGDSIVVPPTEEMTEAETFQWERSLVETMGFASIRRSSIDLNAPLVEAKKTIEDEIPKGSVEYKLLCTRRAEGEMLIGVELSNKWKHHIPNISVNSVWEAQSPQPMEPTGSGIVAMMVGASESAFRREPDGDHASLAPKIPALFASDQQATREMRSRAVALSPEHHWLALCTDGYEFDRIPGAIVAGFFDQWKQG